LSGQTINAGSSSILYSNGSQVVDADTGGISLPLPITQGGTGAVTAAAAVVNLGLNPLDGGSF
jgi:hypothetical protein